MPHFPEPSFSGDLESPEKHLPETTSTSDDPVNSTSMRRDGREFRLQEMRPSDDGCIVFTRLPPSKYLVRFQNADAPSAFPEITHDFLPSCAGDTAPSSHQEAADDFVYGLTLLESETTHEPSEPNDRVASYIEDEGGISHPWVKVSRWDGEKGKGSVQMCLNVQEPSITGRSAADAEPPLSAKDDGVYER